jgi:hypothetical protein
MNGRQVQPQSLEDLEKTRDAIRTTIITCTRTITGLAGDESWNLLLS